MSKYLQAVSEWLGFHSKTASGNSRLMKWACDTWVKVAFGSYLVKSKQQTFSQYYYTAWAALHALEETNAVPAPSTNPSNLNELTRQLSREDPEAHQKIIREWSSGAGSAWEKLLKRGAYLYSKHPDHEEFGTEIYVRYFLTPHAQNSSTPDPPRTSMGKSPSQLKGGVWYRLHKNTSIFDDIASAIGSIMGYIGSQHNPRSTRKVKTMPGNQVDQATVSGFAPVDFKGDEMDSLQAINDYRDDIDEMVVKSIALIPTDIDSSDPEYIKHIKYNLGRAVNEMVDENWMFVVGLKWNDELVQQIAEVCSEVSSNKLAPLVIKKFAIMNPEKLKIFVEFVENCIDPNHKYFGERRAGKTIYYKRLRSHVKSVPQWLNLILAVKGPYRGFSGSLHAGPTAWSTSIRRAYESGESSVPGYLEGLWDYSKDYMPVEAMGLNKVSFISTMERFFFKYDEFANAEGRSKPETRMKSYVKGLFKETDKRYLESIIATPMAEATRMRLIQLVLPSKFESELTSNNYIACGHILERLLDLPSSVVEAVRDMTSDVVVDEVISQVEKSVSFRGKRVKVSPQ